MSGDYFFLRSFLSTKKEFFYEKNTHTDFIPDDVMMILMIIQFTFSLIRFARKFNKSYLSTYQPSRNFFDNLSYSAYSGA